MAILDMCASAPPQIVLKPLSHHQRPRANHRGQLHRFLLCTGDVVLGSRRRLESVQKRHGSWPRKQDIRHHGTGRFTLAGHLRGTFDLSKFQADSLHTLEWALPNGKHHTALGVCQTRFEINAPLLGIDLSTASAVVGRYR